jgi:hypothetical protein
VTTTTRPAPPTPATTIPAPPTPATTIPAPYKPCNGLRIWCPGHPDRGQIQFR